MKIEFVSYNGAYPNLCSGILVLRVNGEERQFGIDHRFWCSGGNCGFSSDWSEAYVESDPWIVNTFDLPDDLKSYAAEVEELINDNIAWGCCGGCI